MNLYFLLFASLLVLIALLFILPPLWRKQPVAAEDMDSRNLAIAKQRLQELKGQLQAGSLTQADYDGQRAELELALSDDFAIAKQHSAGLSGRWMAYVLVFTIPVLAGGLYATLGTYNAIEPSAEMLGAEPDAPRIEDIRKMVDKLAARMQANPDDAEGWIMLGKSYKYLQQFPKAAAAFEQAYRLQGDKPEVMLLYADALAYANDEQLAGKPTELVFKVLELEPDNVTALWFGGMAKAQAGDTATASQLWQKLVVLLPAGSKEQQEVQGLLAKVGSPQETPPAAEPKTGQQTKPSDVAIAVQVSLAAELQKTVRPEDTVFVYAQALAGPKMPLAIVRKQVSDLPLGVTLNDAMAMVPTMKLSNFTEVKLLARVSKSGNAMAQPGDLIGTIESVGTGDKSSHTLIINGAVK
ncbi:MAG: c-type cytochrome biogenesis protein CcmI [Methylovulum sp.]|nr:c-type cytochrome biogenesis protein CcmI [Methylovulum sp.]